MALAGLLSLVQIVALPGYLLLRGLRISAGFVATLVLSFALSLVLNHFLVAGLVVLGIYRPAAVYAIFAAELAIWLALDRQRLAMGFAEAGGILRQRAGAFLSTLDSGGKADCSPTIRLLRRALIAAALAVIGGFAISGIAQMGQIFQQWDAVVSWNRWAVDWAANRLPFATSIYPQLLPTNLSLSYAFMQSSDIWMFAKGFQFLFCLLLLLAMLDLARVEGRFGYVPAVVIAYGLLVALLRFRMLASGYADVPLAFFAFSSVYALTLARNAAGSQDRDKFLLVGALLAAGTALTKQTGLYIAAIYPLLAWRFALGGNRSGFVRHLSMLLRICLLLALLVSPWYLYKLFDIHAGGDHNNTARLLTDFHEGRDLWQRLAYAGNLFVEAVTPPGAAALALAVAASLRDPLQRWLVGIIVLPLGMLWALAFSYDLRNLSMLVPFIGAAAGVGISEMLSRLGADLQCKLQCKLQNGDVENRRQFPRLGHVACLAGMLAIGACMCVSDGTLLNWQRQQQRSVGLPDLNGRLYAYAADRLDEAAFATDYQAMRWLPDLGPRSEECSCRDLAGFRAIFDRPEVRYAVVRTSGAAAEVRAFLQDRNAALSVFESQGFTLYEKRPIDSVKLAAAR